MIYNGLFSRIANIGRGAKPAFQRVWRAVICCILLAAASTVCRAGDIIATGFTISGDGQTTQFSATVSKDVGYTASVLPDPFRIIIDMANVSFDIPPGAGRKPKGLVKAVRYGVLEEGKSRIVVDTDGPVLITKSTLIPARGKKPARVAIELTAIPEDVFRAAFELDKAKPNAAVAAASPVPTEPKPVAKPENAEATSGDVVGSVTPALTIAAAVPSVVKPSLKPVPGEKKAKLVFAKPARPDGKRVVVIDPGHGGIDPGALSPGKTREKDVVLAFAKALQEQIDGDGRHHAVLTREGDTFVSLKDRVSIARKHGADLFIAIHADTLRGMTATGTTIYTLSEKASDDEAEELARRENRADAIAGVDLGGQSEDVAGILIDLAQRDSRNQASMFSRATLRRFQDVTKMTGKPIRSAGFTVLKAPDVPSVLIELGFLSNPKDEERLKSDAWRKTLAKALAAAIDSQFSTAVAVNP